MKIDAVPGITTHYRVTPEPDRQLPRRLRRALRPRARADALDGARRLGRQVRRAACRSSTAPPRTTGAGGGAAPDGKTLFTQGNGTSTACGACHTLADAGTSASTGPDLDKGLKGKRRRLHQAVDRGPRRPGRHRATTRASCPRTSGRRCRRRSWTHSCPTCRRRRADDGRRGGLDGCESQGAGVVSGRAVRRSSASRSPSRSTSSSAASTAGTRSSTARPSCRSRCSPRRCRSSSASARFDYWFYWAAGQHDAARGPLRPRRALVEGLLPGQHRPQGHRHPVHRAPRSSSCSSAG